MPFDYPPPPHSRSDRAASRRVAWVTPDYPPDRGGVSDHSEAMVQELRAAGHEVLVCTKPHERGFAHLNAELAAYRADLVIVAYTPLGYAPRTGGIAAEFTLWSARLRRRLRCQTILLAHEIGLPVGYFLKNGEFKLATLGLIQIAQFAALAASFDAVLFSNLSTKREWARHVPLLRSRFYTTRICSNIPFHASADPAAELTAAGYSVPSPTILFFGTGHEAVLFDYLEAAFLALLELEPGARLVIVGMSTAKLSKIRPSLAALGDRVDALGYVAAPHVSLWLQVAALVLIPLIEGVSARKGTVMAALQHGQAVVTTRGTNTLEDIPWEKICFLAPSERETFATQAVLAFQNADQRAAVGRAARAEYDQHSSPAVTALRIVELANQLRAPTG